MRDSAESGFRASGDREELKEPKPPDEDFDGLGDEKDFDDEDDVDDDERCDENPLLKDEELDGLASTGTEASGRISANANATCAYFEKGFSMVRSADES